MMLARRSDTARSSWSTAWSSIAKSLRVGWLRSKERPSLSQSMTKDRPITPAELQGLCILCGEPLVPRDGRPETAVHIVRRITPTDESGIVLRRGPNDPAEYIVHGWCAERAEKGSRG